MGEDTASPAAKRSQSPKTPRGILANIPPGKDIYSRGQKHLARQKNVLEKKKRALEEEELQKGPKINVRSSSLMRNRRQPGWMRSVSPGTSHFHHQNGSASPSTNRMRHISDVVQACISADQAVERIFATPSPERKNRSSSVNGPRPDFYIKRNAEPGTDVFVSPLEAHQVELIEKQSRKISELEDTLSYLSHLLNVDLAKYKREREERKGCFLASVGVWECVLGYMEFPWVMKMRFLGGGAGRAAGKRYQKWFFEGVKKVFRVNNYEYSNIIVPGEGLVKVLLDHVEAGIAGSGEEVMDGMVLEPPLKISVRGNGDVTFITSFITKDSETTVQQQQPDPPPTLTTELPQGALDVTPHPTHIAFSFSHPRWYPLPGDSVVLILPSAEIPPLTPAISALPAVEFHLLNENFENPWSGEIKATAEEDGAEYELRYIDSLGRVLARSKAFCLGGGE